MAQNPGGLDKQALEEVFRGALKSVLGSTETRVNPRVDFYNRFQREMEEHDREFEKRYDDDLNITLIFSGLFSAVTSAFIIDLQSELKPDYEEMNNALLEMLLNATTGSFPVGSAASVPRWTGPDRVVVQAQCILYTTLAATLLASFLAMLGKQWLNRYRQNETRGSTADRSRMREKKLTGVETWKFHLVMESLPVILQCALVLLGFGLSRYLWEVSRSVSSVVIGFTAFGFLFYLLITVASAFSFDCPFQTPFSLLIRLTIGMALPYLRTIRRAFGPKKRRRKSGVTGLPFSMNAVGGAHNLAVGITTPAYIALTAIQPPKSIVPLFTQEARAESDRLDAKCVGRMFGMSTDSNVTVSIMDFIPEIIWHNGIKDVPFNRVYNILIDCFDYSGPHPVVIPKMRNVAYLSAKAFTHIALQRRCITKCEDHKQDSWKAICANHCLLSPADYNADSDLKTALFMVDMTLGHKDGFPWKNSPMTPTHRAWMSHVFLYCAWHDGQSLSEVVMDFIEESVSLRPLSDAVVTDCLFIIGLMVGVSFHVNDITVRDKSREKKSVLTKIFGALSATFSSKSPSPLAVHALRLMTQIEGVDFAVASCELFHVIMASGNTTEEYWEAARYAIRGAFQRSVGDSATVPVAEEPQEILKFLDYHLGLQGKGEDHTSSIIHALEATLVVSNGRFVPRVVESIRNFNCASPSFVKGMRSVIRSASNTWILEVTIRFIALVHDQWFNSPVSIMKPEEMKEFCERLALVMIDFGEPVPVTRKLFFLVFFGMLRSPEWRNHIVARLWSVLAHWTLADEEESFKWCLQNAIELLDFTRRLPDRQGFKWWYGMLWFHFDKLDPTVRGEVERIGTEMSSGDDLSDLNLYLNLIGQEVERIRRTLDGPTGDGRSDMGLRARFVVLEGNYRKLARITGG